MHQKTSDTYSSLWSHLESESSRRLLLAALDAFAARGFAGATTRDIASRAGMSPAAVYVHYRSKNAMLYEIMRIGHEKVWRDVTEALQDIEGPAERLRTFTEAFVLFHIKYHTLARVAQYELPALSGEQLRSIGRLRRRFEVLVREMLTDGVSQGIFEFADVSTTTVAILSLGIDVARWYGPRSRQADGGDIAPLYAELALRMIRPWRPGRT